MEPFETKATWAVPPSAPNSEPGTTDLWRVFLPGMAAFRPHARQSLADAELEALDEITRAKTRDGYLLTRGILRSLLATWCDCAPAQVADGALSDAGSLADVQPGDSPVYYASAFAGDWALIAISGSAPVGVAIDWSVERRHNITRAKDVLSRREWHALKEAAAAQQERLLLDLLARKLALGQAAAIPNSHALKHITVPLSGTPSVFRPDRQIPELGRHSPEWWISPLVWATGYSASICTRPAVRRIATWQWTIDCVRYQAVEAADR